MQVKIINKSPFELPKYETTGSAAFDIRANLGKDMTIEIYPGGVMVIPTGLYVELPPGIELQLRSRSGLASKYKIIVLNAPGTIDSDYRGEIKIILMNLHAGPYMVSHGDRIAQGVVAPYIKAEWKEVQELSETERGTGGFGSTGMN